MKNTHEKCSHISNLLLVKRRVVNGPLAKKTQVVITVNVYTIRQVITYAKHTLIYPTGV